VRLRHGPELLASLREGDVERLLAAPEPSRELQAQGRLAGAGIALDEMEPRSGQPAAKDMVESFDACGHTGSGFHTVDNVEHSGEEEWQTANVRLVTSFTAFQERNGPPHCRLGAKSKALGGGAAHFSRRNPSCSAVSTPPATTCVPGRAPGQDGAHQLRLLAAPASAGEQGTVDLQAIELDRSSELSEQEPVPKSSIDNRKSAVAELGHPRGVLAVLERVLVSSRIRSSASRPCSARTPFDVLEQIAVLELPGGQVHAERQPLRRGAAQLWNSRPA